MSAAPRSLLRHFSRSGSLDASIFRRALMCPPTYYEAAQSDKKIDQIVANQQWQYLKSAYEHAGIIIEIVDPVPNLPYMTFACDAGLSLGNEVYLGTLKQTERQSERSAYEHWFVEHGYDTTGEPNTYFEGGDGDFFNPGLFFAGFGMRTQREAYDIIQAKGSFLLVPCELVDERFYHLNMCLCVLDDNLAMWYPAAFSKESQERMKATGVQLLEITEGDALKLACNAVTIGRTVIIPKGCNKTVAMLEKRGFELTEVDVGEFVKCGGACRSLMMKL